MASIVYKSPSGFQYTYLLPYEKAHLSESSRVAKLEWMKQNWHYVFLISAVYLTAIYGLKKFMKNRVQYELRVILIIWNAFLAVFSILGALRTVPEFAYIITEKGIKYSVCTETFSYGITGLWSSLFILSKPLELLDTVFLILRKRDLIFLHWYQHLTVLLYVWYAMVEYPTTGRWFATINYSIHAIMYTYYTIMALKIVRVPKLISMFITSLQIIQMVVGVYVNVKAYQYKKNGEACGVSYENIYIALLMYASYFYLFFKFFFDKYFIDTKQKKN